MKPAPFDHVAPGSIDEAVSALASGGDDAKILAGGQSLVPLLSLRFAQPSLLVDLNRVSELAYVRPADDGGLAIGAMTRTHQLEVDPIVAERIPLAAEAAPLISHRQIRNRGTIGGSIAHADPSAELPAVALALGATLVSRSPRGERQTAAADFFRGYFTTALEADEILTEVRFPPARPGTGSAVLEVSRRAGDFALVGAAATVTLDDGACASASVVVFGVADRPVAVPAAAEVLRGGPVTAESARAAGAAVCAAVEPGSDIHATGAYRKQVAGVLARRALGIAAGRAAS
ncbi:MAG: xanthine dehydrogenase family protein subunit M [Thermoleophilia bacterium]|nr:xanthine dehydrogenase family protein subunit M [Thermoleophilia bacterium]